MNRENVDRKQRGYLRKFFTYIYLRMVRSRGTPEYVAGGVALGLAIGLIIPIGFQIIIVIPLAFLLRVAKVPAVIFTFVTNHFTVIFIYPFQCWIGAMLTGSGYSELMAELDTFFKDPTVHNFLNIGWGVAVAFLVGGAVLAVLAAVPGYFISKAMVIEFRKKRAEHLMKKNQRKKLQ